jgi:hypothetical protein
VTTIQPKFNAAKFKELLLYAAERSAADEFFGATKLNKILFFSDFLAYGMTGFAITWATYVRRQNGPVPEELVQIRGELIRNKEAALIPKKFFNKTQQRLVAMRSANRHIFSAEEIDLIDEVIEHLAPMSASEASELSHERSYAWEIADEGEKIPYSAVFLSRRKPTARDIERGQELARKHGWLQNTGK